MYLPKANAPIAITETIVSRLVALLPNRDAQSSHRAPAKARHLLRVSLMPQFAQKFEQLIVGVSRSRRIIFGSLENREPERAQVVTATRLIDGSRSRGCLGRHVATASWSGLFHWITSVVGLLGVPLKVTVSWLSPDNNPSGSLTTMNEALSPATPVSGPTYSTVKATPDAWTETIEGSGFCCCASLRFDVSRIILR
jgi:hypothetical protein